MVKDPSVEHRVEWRCSRPLLPIAHGLQLEGDTSPFLKQQRHREGVVGNECHIEGEVGPRPSEPPKEKVTAGAIFEDSQKGL